MNAIRIPAIAFFSMLVSSLAWSQTRDDSQIPGLIKQLGSTNVKLRDAALISLMERPEAAPALREALRSPDAEIARRAEQILDHLDRAPLRELDAAIKEGRIERVIDLATQLPEGKYEYEIMRSVIGLARRIDAASKKSPKGEKDKADFISLLEIERIPMKVKTLSESTKAVNNRLYFVRAEKVDIDYERILPAKQGNRFAFGGSVVVSAGTACLTESPPVVILAGGDIETWIHGNSLIVSAGNVKVKRGAIKSLIIAKGSVEVESAFESRIISGKSVNCKESRASAITENDPNPLGVIRWADAPKEKTPAKSK